MRLSAPRNKTPACRCAVFAGAQNQSSNRRDVDSESDCLPPAGLVVKKSLRSVCTRTAVTRAKTGRKK